MISFKNDYTELIHPSLLLKITESNLEYDEPYGFDSYGVEAEKLIRRKVNNKNVDVHFISGGTQTNLIAIASALYTFESVIATDISHINIHETGAIEATGHKIYGIQHINGKLDLEATKKFVEESKNQEHVAVPKLVCITNSTEYGTYYTKSEIEEIYKFCKEEDLYLFIDGARMASALVAKNNDIKYEDLPNLCDIFYFGGTKNGAMFGEALVIVNDKLKKNYKAVIKQRGGLLAKGRLMGIQFAELFRYDLYLELGEHANNQAEKIKSIIKKHGFEIYLESETNQIFIIMNNNDAEKIMKEVYLTIDSKIDDNKSLVRFVTSWGTTDSSIEELDKIMNKLFS